ncbi:MAG: O-methyltransferase, family 3 [Fibrobacteres bacterium]|nr:O-methyltransferase, family 3 [Fibrobacterota bacterium]
MAMPRYEDLDIPAADQGTAISRAEAEFLHGLVARLKPAATLEVGMGYGCSAAYIISGAGVTHYAMDPLQSDYQGLGLRNVAKLGLDGYMKFFPEFSHAALPRLAAEGVKVDFAFIDGGHRFDDIFIDFYYAELLLRDGGHICLHDAWMRSTQTVASWVRRNKKNFVQVPTPMKNLILFRKRGEDDRAWNHFRGFGTWKSLVSHSVNTLKRKARAALGR